MKKLFLVFLFIFTVHKIYPGLFSGYDKKSPEEVIRDLAIEQIDNPDDSYINYNLGVALYQTHKYEDAKNNFERAVGSAKNKKLKERSYFNLANSCYKNALSFLPENWESDSTKIEQDKLAAAIDNATTSVKNYESLLVSNKEHEHAKANLKKARNLVEKLMKKQQQQKQDQKQDQNKDDKKDQDNKNDMQDKQNQKDQQSGDKSKQEQQQKQDGQQDQSQDKSSGEEKKQDQSGEQQQDTKQDKSQKESLGQEQKQYQAKPGEQKESQQLKESDPQSQAQQMQAQEAQKESAEEKLMRLMLEKLQSDEDNLQKLMLQRQTKGQNPLQSGQKPW